MLRIDEHFVASTDTGRRSDWQPLLAKVISGFADKTEYGPSSIALQGLQQSDAQLASAASNIASFQSNAPAGGGVDTVDLSAAVVALLSAKNSYSANVASVKAADEIQKTTIDLIA